MKPETIQKLKDYFEKRDDVSMAFLFGSQAKGQAHKGSDTDIAVYFRSDNRSLELEQDKEYATRDEIFHDLDSIIETPIDLIVLNGAPAPLAYNVLDTGVPLAIRDKNLYWRFLFFVWESAEDFYKIAEEWMEIRARSMSLSEKDKNILVRLIDFTSTEMLHLADFKNVDQFTYERNRDTQLKLERWVERLTVSLIDIAKIVLSSQKKKSLQGSSVEMVRALGWEMGVGENEVNLMGKFAELRNLLAHEYMDLRYAGIRKFLDNSETIYSKVLAYSKDYIDKSK